MIALAVVGVVAAPIGFASGLIHYHPRGAGVIARTMLVAPFIPALGEEAPFRGLLIPDRRETARAWVAIFASTALFTVWHVVETLWQPAQRHLFTRPDFLGWAAWLGLWCAILRRRSGSIWPGLALHWAAVVIWIGWLGGPD